MKQEGLATPASSKDRVVSPRTSIFKRVADIYILDRLAVTLDAKPLCDQLPQFGELCCLDNHCSPANPNWLYPVEGRLDSRGRLPHRRHWPHHSNGTLKQPPNGVPHARYSKTIK